MIYAQFFPQGSISYLNILYFSQFFVNSPSQSLNFQDFVQNLSILSRGSLEEKLQWAFSLYDINGDGYITREEMTDIVTAIYDLMGKMVEPCIEECTVTERVDRIFQVSILLLYSRSVTQLRYRSYSVVHHFVIDLEK
ncbi:unnamed protein product [Acanthoscelides obtectus]|uniref:EF-hand domain-containing protein n=1 Tax=Acanthoscelides obtectus TaxID=200917 RepID=A0A9P0PMJ0_ACAOB|nr:unnamed protein product [Acanthoscelides obtectus]CAK1636474.1 Kv channel-interacting protein 4 [Acanthoscelides obtectus]